MNSARSVSLVCALLTINLAGQLPLKAQGDTAGTAAIIGTVADKTDLPIPDATVAVRNQASGAVRTGKTEADGQFSVGNLPAGVYSVDVAATGFSADSRNGLRLDSAMTVTLPISMQVASSTQSITVEAAVTLAVEAAPSQSSLEAKSAESVISSTYIRNFISSTGDYSDVLQMAPGTFSVSANGPGLGDTKTFFRGFKDGTYSMTYDGIPFNDTNDPTHHSWVFFPAQTIGSRCSIAAPASASFDRTVER